MQLKSVQILNEVLWFVGTACLCAVLFLPIYNLVEFKYYPRLILFIGLSVYYLRYTFMFQQAYPLHKKAGRVAVFSFNLFLIVQIVRLLQDTSVLWDTHWLDEFVYGYKQTLSNGQTDFLLHYIHQLSLISGLTLLVLCFALNFRIVKAFYQKRWRQMAKG